MVAYFMRTGVEQPRRVGGSEPRDGTGFFNSLKLQHPKPLDSHSLSPALLSSKFLSFLSWTCHGRLSLNGNQEGRTSRETGFGRLRPTRRSQKCVGDGVRPENHLLAARNRCGEAQAKDPPLRRKIHSAAILDFRTV